MKNIKDFRMPIFVETSAAGKIHDAWIIGYDQQGLWFLLRDGSIKTFYKDQIKKIISKNPGFPCKGQQIMRIRAEQSQQWNPDLLPELDAIGQELKFDSGPTKEQLEKAKAELKKPTKVPERTKTAQSHWLGME